MISLAELRAGLRGDWAVFEPEGTLLDMEPPTDLGPAVMLVTELVDAMKMVESGFVVGSVDRDRLWSLAGAAVRREVLDQLSGGEFELSGLIEAVFEAGFAWQVTPISGLEEPSR